MDQSEQERRLGEMQLKCEMLEEERKTLRKNLEEMEGRARESKELYLYAE